MANSSKSNRETVTNIQDAITRGNVMRAYEEAQAAQVAKQDAVKIKFLGGGTGPFSSSKLFAPKRGYTAPNRGYSAPKRDYSVPISDCTRVVRDLTSRSKLANGWMTIDPYAKVSDEVQRIVQTKTYQALQGDYDVVARDGARGFIKVLTFGPDGKVAERDVSDDDVSRD